MKVQDAAELRWQMYWDDFKKHPAYAEIKEANTIDFILQGYKEIMKNAFLSGFLTAVEVIKADAAKANNVKRR